jgi:hypothetical protein
MRYENNVFINCPFDAEYKPIFDAVIFAVQDAGFAAKCALELSDATQNRLAKIMEIVSACQYGIHDISRTELSDHQLPRFNMPLELGIFLGCQRFGGKTHRSKSCLVLDRERYRYQKFISDIAGQDVYSHDNNPKNAVLQVRNWLRTASQRTNIPGGEAIWKRFNQFQQELPAICQQMRIQVNELTFADYTHVVHHWLQRNVG